MHSKRSRARPTARPRYPARMRISRRAIEHLRSSQPNRPDTRLSTIMGLVENADTLVDRYFGPNAPRGFEKTGFPLCPALQQAQRTRQTQSPAEQRDRRRRQAKERKAVCEGGIG